MKFALVLVAALCLLQTVSAATAGVGPIEEAIPAWASKNDMCFEMRSCDECASHQYCKYTDAGVPNCCMRPAGAAPIELPAWASDRDLCVSIPGGCDNCNTTEYCKFNKAGAGLCCSRALLGAEQKQAVPEPAMAGVSPIVESPIPSWASSADVCMDIKSCDECEGVKNAYCKYTDAVPSCCIRPAGVTPIVENPIPTWASSSDVCKSVGTCDACSPNDSQYCQFSKDGAASCCQRADGAVASEEPAVKFAGVSPIVENPIPAWASDRDTCVAAGCDSCAAEQYCRYGKNGASSCCSRALLGTEQDAAEVKFAGVGPITENPVPFWASEHDHCSEISTCDNCQGEMQYCKYSKAGRATCCKPKAQ